MIELRAAGQRATVSARGAALRSWVADGVERLSWFDPADPRHAYDGAVLAPWPNRIRGGRYAFAGGEHELTANEPATGAALHGLVATTPWDVLAAGPAAARLATTAGPRPGYPFRVRLEVEYRLSAGGLAAELTARNDGPQPAPFGAGFHPYLRLPDGVDGARLEVPAAAFLPVDDRGLPVGGFATVDGTPLDLRRPARLDSRRIDHCFALTPGSPARLWPAGGAAPLTLRLDPAFPFLHVYTDEQSPRPRTRLALEPVTCPPDAFNSGAGLLTLLPGASWRAGWRLSL